MAEWKDKAVILFRDAIGDTSSPYTYEKTRLESLLITAAYLVSQSISFSTTYTIDVLGGSITPDPKDDNDFLALTVLKAIAVLADSEWRTESRNGMIVKDGPTSIDYTEVVKAKELYAKEMKSRFENAKIAYQCGDYSAGLAIIGPARFDLGYYSNLCPPGRYTGRFN